MAASRCVMKGCMMQASKQEHGMHGRRSRCDEEALSRAAGHLREALSLLVGDGAEGLPVVAEDRLMRLPEVLRLTGMCRSALYDQMSRGEFPRSIKIGPRAASWSARAVRNWISQRVEG